MLMGLRANDLRGICGAAEAIPVRSSAVDVVTAAQAFHWFQPDGALPEIHRVLNAKGHLGLLWNLRDERTGWVHDLSKIIGSEDAMSATIGDHERFGDDPSHGALRASPLFGEIEHRVFEFVQELSPELLLALVRSRSYFSIRPPDQQRVLIDEVRALCAGHPALTGRTRFVMPYKTHAFRVSINT
jgi:SAM-dependent methyltransferase